MSKLDLVGFGPISAESIAVGITLISFLLGLAVVWGTHKSRIEVMDREIEDLKAQLNEWHREYVSFKHFDAVMSETKDTIRRVDSEIKSIQTDVKEILRHVRPG